MTVSEMSALSRTTLLTGGLLSTTTRKAATTCLEFDRTRVASGSKVDMETLTRVSDIL